MGDHVVQNSGSQDSPVSDAGHALLSDDHTAAVTSEGAWLTQDPGLPGWTGLLTQDCADDNDVVLRAPSLVHLCPPVQGSESEEGAEEGSRLWLQELLGLNGSRGGHGFSSPTLPHSPHFHAGKHVKLPAPWGHSAGKISPQAQQVLGPRMAN